MSRNILFHKEKSVYKLTILRCRGVSMSKLSEWETLLGLPSDMDRREWRDGSELMSPCQHSKCLLCIPSWAPKASIRLNTDAWQHVHLIVWLEDWTTWVDWIDLAVPSRDASATGYLLTEQDSTRHDAASKTLDK
jgi:hypothetical protein